MVQESKSSSPAEYKALLQDVVANFSKEEMEYALACITLLEAEVYCTGFGKLWRDSRSRKRPELNENTLHHAKVTTARLLMAVHKENDRMIKCRRQLRSVYRRRYKKEQSAGIAEMARTNIKPDGG